MIHTGSLPFEWDYVTRDDNPADDGSKGLKLDTMMQKNDRWLKGPKFLWQDKSHWPRAVEIPTLTDHDLKLGKKLKFIPLLFQVNFWSP